MRANADHFSVAIDAVDAVVGNLGPVPAPIAAMLFGDHDAVRPQQLLALSLKVACPKLGAQLLVTSDDESSQPQDRPQVRCIEPLISHISCSVGTAGTLQCLHLTSARLVHKELHFATSNLVMPSTLWMS